MKIGESLKALLYSIIVLSLWSTLLYFGLFQGVTGLWNIFVFLSWIFLLLFVIILVGLIVADNDKIIERMRAQGQKLQRSKNL